MKALLALALLIATPALAETKDVGWKQRVAKLFADPAATYNRTCSPDSGKCISVVRSGLAQATILQHQNGTAMLRILCVFNDTGERRRCVDWDRDVGFEEVKTSSGWMPAR